MILNHGHQLVCYNNLSLYLLVKMFYSKINWFIWYHFGNVNECCFEIHQHSGKKNQHFRRSCIHTKFERLNIKKCRLYIELIILCLGWNLSWWKTLIKYISTAVTFNPITTVTVPVGNTPAEKCWHCWGRVRGRCTH